MVCLTSGSFVLGIVEVSCAYNSRWHSAISAVQLKFLVEQTSGILIKCVQIVCVAVEQTAFVVGVIPRLNHLILLMLSFELHVQVCVVDEVHVFDQVLVGLAQHVLVLDQVVLVRAPAAGNA